jgi:hypothetical protein
MSLTPGPKLRWLSKAVHIYLSVVLLCCWCRPASSAAGPTASNVTSHHSSPADKANEVFKGKSK